MDNEHLIFQHFMPLDNHYDYLKKLTQKQRSFAAANPDGIWQMSQRIKKEFAEKGVDVSVFVISKVAINRGDSRTLVDPAVDMASAKWDWSMVSLLSRSAMVRLIFNSLA